MHACIPGKENWHGHGCSKRRGDQRGSAGNNYRGRWCRAEKNITRAPAGDKPRKTAGTCDRSGHGKTSAGPGPNGFRMPGTGDCHDGETAFFRRPVPAGDRDPR
jgi:hypothetical protein